MTKDEVVYEACLLLVRHFRNLLLYKINGFNTRIFSHMLHPERDFVFLGTSVEASTASRVHPEHVVPCAVLIVECCRLISAGQPDELVAELLKKHWKIAYITKEQAYELDHTRKLKSTMPPNWNFETGNTLERLNVANIQLVEDPTFKL